MSKPFTRKTVDNSVENNILTASIISTHFVEQIYPTYEPRYMRNTYAKLIMNWVMAYFENFGEAPKQTIEKIFEVEKEKISEEEATIIQIFLATLSKHYVENQGVNEDYILKVQALPHFRQREIELSLEAAQGFLSIGKIDKAEETLLNMKKVMLQTSNWCNPFDPEEIAKTFAEEKKGVFRFPGALGDLLGDIQPGWFTAFLAPFKRGKTWLLQEAVVIAALMGLPAVFISLEMQNDDIKGRMYKRLTAYGPEGKSHHTVPVFDCVRNQDGTCAKSCRTNLVSLYDGESPLPDFSPDMDYRPCSVCRGDKSDDYEMATWFEVLEKKEFTAKNVHKRMKGFARFYGDNIRIISYPRFSASLSDIERDLDLLAQVEGFIPVVCSVDYADILRPEGSRGGGEPRHGIDEIWKRLAAMAMSRYMCVFSASQGNRGSIYKENMGQDDLAEWIGKLAHVDKFACVNQSLDEKRKGIIRVGMLADRHKEFHEKDQAVILQALTLGQVHLDSHHVKGR